MSQLVTNPFPGPQPYRASDRARFFGREDMSRLLQGSLLANRCVTVHGPSGAGKSSLMQASVIPSLVDAQNISVALVDRWPEAEEPTRWLTQAVYADLGLGEPPEGASAEDALCVAAKRAARRSPRIMLLYLDQVEQLLAVSRSSDAAEAFFGSLSRILELPLRTLRVAISLREDYLGAFRDCARDHRRLLDHAVRVGPLSVGELSEAVLKAAAAGDPPQTWDREQVRALMLQVRVPGQAATDKAEAQSTYAQIVCRALFQQRARGDGASSDVEAEPILRAYLETTLDALGPLKGAAHRLLEEHLITEDGSRTLRTEKELLQTIPEEKLSPVLRALEGAAIIHAEDHQGSRYFEIGHDWLAKKVLDQRQQREREAEQRRELQRQREASEARLAKERKQQRRRLAAVAAASVVLLGSASALGFSAWQQKRNAEEQRLRAEEAARRAEIDLAEARTAEEEARRRADRAQVEAKGALEMAWQDAEGAQKEAERALKRARTVAEEAQKEVERAQKEVERARKGAEQAQKEAEQAQKEARQQAARAQNDAARAKDEVAQARMEAAQARADAQKAQNEAREARLAAEGVRRRTTVLEQQLRECRSSPPEPSRIRGDPNEKP